MAHDGAENLIRRFVVWQSVRKMHSKMHLLILLNNYTAYIHFVCVEIELELESIQHNVDIIMPVHK